MLIGKNETPNPILAAKTVYDAYESLRSTNLTLLGKAFTLHSRVSGRSHSIRCCKHSSCVPQASVWAPVRELSQSEDQWTCGSSVPLHPAASGLHPARAPQECHEVTLPLIHTLRIDILISPALLSVPVVWDQEVKIMIQEIYYKLGWNIKASYWCNSWDSFHN